MRARLNSTLFPATFLFIAIAGPAFAQMALPEKPAGVELSAAVAGTLVWGEDDMGIPVNIVIHNRAGEDARSLVATSALFSDLDVSANAGEIFQSNCPDRVTADMEAHGLSLPRDGVKQIRVISNTDVEELGPNADAMPILLVCANYKLARTGENHRGAVLYRLLHIDPARGPRPIDRVTGDIPAQSLKLEEIGRYAK